MSTVNRRPILLSIVLLITAFTLAPALHAGQISAPGAAPGAPCAPTLEDLFAAAPAVCPAGDAAVEIGIPDVLPLQPHCCSQQEVDACRANCKAQGPGCKGQIGCRAGECVCTCVCP
jgi:hypothetical protein